jgi:hypothetical protein
MSGLRFPKVMPAHWYRDPAEVLADRLILSMATASLVSCGTSTVHAHAQRDGYYTQARRLHIRSLMKGKA